MATPKRKQIPLRLQPEMQEALEKWATDEFRSVNGQIEWLLHNALREAGRLPTKKKGKPVSNKQSKL